MVIVRAPARISFGGGGTDVAAYYTRYGGFVVSTAIARYASVMAYASNDGAIRVTSADYDRCESFPRGTLPAVREPLSLPKAAIARFARHGLSERGVDLFLTSEVPPGTGLGSSSAMAVALVRALGEHTGVRLTADEVAELASVLEIDDLGMPIGKQDQYASAFGGLNTIEFSTSGVRVSPLPVGESTLQALDERLLLFSTGTRRHSGAVLSRQHANPTEVDGLHRIKALAYEMCERLRADDLDGFGTLLHRSWLAKRQLSSGVSSTHIDTCYDVAREAGALGGKITGAGGGGFLLVYCASGRQREVRRALGSLGLEELRFTFDRDGAVVSGLPDVSRLDTSFELTGAGVGHPLREDRRHASRY